MAKCQSCDLEAASTWAFCKNCLSKLSRLDRQFSNTLTWIILVPLCCNGLALVLSLVGVFGCKHPYARANAKLMLGISSIVTLLGLIAALSK